MHIRASPSWFLWIFQCFLPATVTRSHYFTSLYIKFSWLKPRELCKKKKETAGISLKDDFTCLWVEDLRGEVRWRCAGGEVFIAVGDEGRQWVDVVGMLHHWDFIGLLMKKRNKQEEEAHVIYEQDEVTNNATSVSYIRVKTELLCLQLKMCITITHVLYMHMIPIGHCSKQMHGVNRPSCVNALYGKHHSLCVWPALWCNLDRHQETLRKACRHMPRALRPFSWGENCLFSPTRKTTVPPSPKVTQAGHKQTQSGKGKRNSHKQVESSSPTLSDSSRLMGLSTHPWVG